MSNGVFARQYAGVYVVLYVESAVWRPPAGLTAAYTSSLTSSGLLYYTEGRIHTQPPAASVCGLKYSMAATSE